MTDKITFSFGRNWKDYVRSIGEQNIKSAQEDIVAWLGVENIKGKKILDIGSGSGIHSFCFNQLEASKIFSFDYDQSSVEATLSFRERAGNPDHWTVTQGSILDPDFLRSIEKADIVYSWGVLHHTGDMWNAIRNAAGFVKEGGYFFISIYAKGPNYPDHLALKRKFNAQNPVGKFWMIWNYIFRRIIWQRVKKRKNPFAWNEKKARGMTVYYDVVDWLGGLPYEVATEEELSGFLSPLGFTLEKKLIKGEGACHRLLYRKFKI